MDAENTKKYRGVLESMHRGEFQMPAINVDARNEPISRKEFTLLGKKLDGVIDAVNGNRVSVSQRLDRDGLAQVVETYQLNEKRRFAR